MAVIIDDDDEREDKDDTEESMDHPTRNRRQLEELVYHLEETKIEMQKKGENFVPMRSSNNNANEIGLDALAPSLAKPVSASREMFERAKETLVLSGKTKITTVCFSNKSGALGYARKIEANERIFEHSWREQRAARRVHGRD